ncbi:Ribokinase [Dyadobacter sp. CECT 9275]|uniref:Ribokinase n=1 Tax=Dyadobacter helix TaxID=2822344 RepID=A0A916JBS5_9BACT|nr:PfkB family carbohydrate kinase [Dyadobacter sp. CECT 9275]CAG4994022.1 Ribokinase [Dyadobacter sp. CECT 9275]
MYDICTIGHITLDKVVTSQSVKYMPGGTSFYFSKALQHFDLRYILVTALGSGEKYIVDGLREAAIEVHALESDFTVHFENIYSHNQDHREQNVLHTAAPFDVPQMPSLSSKIFHLGPLLSDDISVALVKELASKGEVSLDIQGFLRYVKDKKVYYTDWADKTEALPHITYLKANEFEMEAVTGTTDVQAGARYLATMGVREVIITLGSKGSVIYSNGEFHEIPAYQPTAVVDATGCGDTYMAGYLYQKIKGASIVEAGRFGAAMATLKIESSGPFSGNRNIIEKLIRQGAYTHEISTPVFDK